MSQLRIFGNVTSRGESLPLLISVRTCASFYNYESYADLVKTRRFEPILRPSINEEFPCVMAHFVELKKSGGRTRRSPLYGESREGGNHNL